MAVFLEKVLLVILDFIARMLFTAYWLLPWGILLLILVSGLGMIPGLEQLASAARTVSATLLPWPWLVLVALLISHRFFVKRSSPDNNPHRQYVGWTGHLDAKIDALFAWVGTLKYFRSPWSIVEDPGSYRIRGDEVRQLIDAVLQPGDILLRGYDGYVDGLLIGQAGGGAGLGKYFSHAALFIGDVDDVRDKPIVARRLLAMNEAGCWVEALAAQKEAIRNSPEYYQPGRQKVIHSMSRGVFVEDILTFVRCDYLAVLRLVDTTIVYDEDDKEHAAERMLIPDLAGEGRAIHDRLMRGETVPVADILAAVRHSALGKIGSCYDFQFNNVKAAHMFSCSEFVYYCFKSIHCYLGLLPVRHAFMERFFPRETITPADIYRAAVDAPAGRKRLEVVWLSHELRARQA